LDFKVPLTTQSPQDQWEQKEETEDLLWESKLSCLVRELVEDAACSNAFPKKLKKKKSPPGVYGADADSNTTTTQYPLG